MGSLTTWTGGTGLEYRLGKRFSSSPEWSDCPCGPSSLIQCVLVPFPGVKWPAYDVNQSPPSSAEFKNEWSCTSASPKCFHGVDKDNFTFTFLIG